MAVGENKNNILLLKCFKKSRAINLRLCMNTQTHVGCIIKCDTFLERSQTIFGSGCGVVHLGI
jgi:hypothetical protein